MGKSVARERATMQKIFSCAKAPPSVPACCAQARLPQPLLDSFSKGSCFLFVFFALFPLLPPCGQQNGPGKTRHKRGMKKKTTKPGPQTVGLAWGMITACPLRHPSNEQDQDSSGSRCLQGVSEMNISPRFLLCSCAGSVPGSTKFWSHREQKTELGLMRFSPFSFYSGSFQARPILPRDLRACGASARLFRPARPAPP